MAGEDEVRATTFLDIVVILFSTLTTFLIFLSAINKSIGIRRAYVNMLVKIFEFGRQNIEATKKRNHRKDSDDDNTSKDKHKDYYETLNPDKKQLNGSVESVDELYGENGNFLISRDAVLLPDGDRKQHHSKANGIKEWDGDMNDKASFNLSICLDYMKAGIEAIIEDEVTSRFEAEELKNWNLLTRTNRHYEFISLKLTVIWMTGFVIRYCILMPIRVFICFIGVIWLTICTAIVGTLPDVDQKRKIVEAVLYHCFGILSSAISAVVYYHNTENRPKGGICVANHTSPIDVLVLMCDSNYSLIGQRHGGFLGVLQRALARASPHIWFERAEAKDRHAVSERLRQHISDPKNPPILIFPEGTCINNTSVMQFKKGSFEVGSVIYPVAIKYDPRFGDAFWNSSKYSMMQYLYMMMTSWAIVCDVWYLPPMYREEGESAIDFASRVKSVIAKKGGLVDLVWDGQLKRMKPKKEWKEKQQIELSKQLKMNDEKMNEEKVSEEKRNGDVEKATEEIGAEEPVNEQKLNGHHELTNGSE